MFTASKNVKISLFLCLIQLRLSNCQKRPHIIFILADDLGFNDVGFHGSSQIPTPNIDALAYSGLILNNYYVNPICTPSRSALMTGKHPIHTGMQHTVLYGGEPRGLSLEETLLPQHLKKLGYTNRIVGKWHLGSWKLKYTPTYRGFDSHLGFWTGHHDYNDHTAMENAMWGLDMRRNGDVAHDLHGKYSTDVFTNEAVRLISTHNTSKPLFLYLAHAAVHSGNPYNPLAAPDNIVAKFTHIDDYNRRRFAGVLSKLDESVGLVVKALHNAKMLSDSIIVFSTDNGGPADGFNLNAASNWPLRGVKNTLWEGGVRGAGLLWSPLLTKTKRVATQMMHITDWLPTLYAAAGGNTTDLGKLDGYNLWDVLSKDERSRRNDVLHNIDDIYGNAALTLGPWKIIKATVGSITDGLQYGWSSPVVPKLLSPESPVHIEEAHIAWIESLYMIGGIAGLPITIFLVNKVGRKFSILLAAVAHLVAWILLAFATNIEMIFAGRFITGMAADIAFVAVPMYIAELSHQKIRGFLTGFIYLGSLIGIIIVYSVGPYVEIYVLSIIGGVFDAVQLLSLSFLPPSPYYLLVKEDKDEARKALQFFRGTKDVDAELAEIAAGVQRQQNEKGRPVDLVLDKGNRKALIIMTVLNASQHFSSLSVMLMNIHTILYDAATIIEANMAAYIFSIVQFIAAVCALSIVDKYGRKSLLIISSFLTGISLALLASYFAVRDSGVDVSAYNWVPVASVLLYAAAFRCGLGIVPIVLTGELFSTRMKAIGMTTVDAMYVIFGTIAIFLYQELSNLYGLYCPFYIFAGCCVLTALFAIFYIPETNKKTLEEIQFILKGLPIENSHM